MATNLTIAGAHERTVKGHVDKYYGGDNAEAYPDLATAYATIPVGIRPGKTFGVYVSGTIVEYWWPDATNTANGQEVPKNSTGNGLGTWIAMPNQNSYIINQNIDFEYNNSGSIVFIRGQFSLSDSFSGTTILLGTLPVGNRPKAQIKRIIDTAYLTIDTNGDISLVSEYGMNIPTASSANEDITIIEFYKPVVPIGGDNVTFANGQSFPATATVLGSTLVLTPNGGETVAGYIIPGNTHSVIITYTGLDTLPVTVNGETKYVGNTGTVGNQSLTFYLKTDPITISI